MPNALLSWLNDIAADPRRLAQSGISTQLMAEFQALAGEIDGRGWVQVAPVGTAHLSATDGLGVMASYWIDYKIRSPQAVVPDGTGGYLVASLYSGVAKYDSNWAFRGYFATLTQAPSPNDIAIDIANNRVYVINRWHMTLQAYDLATGAIVWTFGTSGQRGSPWQGLLWEPQGVAVLSNGNVLVSDIATGQNAGGAGVVAEIDAATGALVAERLISKDRFFEPWVGNIDRPGRVRVFTVGGRELVFVGFATDAADCIVAFDPANGWAMDTIYERPQNLPAGRMIPAGFYVSADHNELVVFADGPKMLGGIDISTHQLKWIAGRAFWDDNANALNRVGDMWGGRDVIELAPGKYLVADDGNQRLMVLPNTSTYDVQYAPTTPIPAGWRYVQAALPAGYQPGAGPNGEDIYTAPLGDAPAAGPIVMPIERSV